jgi:hypothetical protein
VDDEQGGLIKNIEGCTEHYAKNILLDSRDDSI